MIVGQPAQGTTFDPITLLLLGTAFDRAWSEVERHFGDADAHLARSRLADAVMIIAADYKERDVDTLKNEALQVLALAYRGRWPLNWHQRSRGERASRYCSLYKSGVDPNRVRLYSGVFVSFDGRMHFGEAPSRRIGV